MNQKNQMFLINRTGIAFIAVNEGLLVLQTVVWPIVLEDTYVEIGAS
jgi:hypothetical protein